MQGRARRDGGGVFPGCQGGCRGNSALSASRGCGDSPGVVATTASGGTWPPAGEHPPQAREKGASSEDTSKLFLGIRTDV